MTFHPDRRVILGGAALLVPGRAFAAGQDPVRALAALEKARGLHIGVTAQDTGSGRTILYRENERFLMCSTFKMMLVAAILARVDAGKEQGERLVHYTARDLQPYAPEGRKNLGHGMTINQLCSAAILYSDNTAANLLFAALGGPPALQRFARSMGDSVTNFNRIEGALNVPDGDKDTTRPPAMLADMKALLLGNVLSVQSRKQLTDWMIACTTGLTKLRSAMPAGWKAGDKTGSGSGRLNDLAIMWPPANRPPLIICAYTAGNKENDADGALADIGRIILAAFA